MWQCSPVKKDIVRIAHFSFLIALISCSPCAVSAQSNVGSNTIVDVKEDRGRGSAVISTSIKKPLPRPIIQFLQGENGNTVLVADFNDVVFPGATKVINVNASPLGAAATTGSARGIKLVRIGRFQENPPIFRVAVVSSDAEQLKNVNFVSGPGSLVVKWPKSSSAISADAHQAVSGAAHGSSAPHGTAATQATAANKMPPLAPSYDSRAPQRRVQTTYNSVPTQHTATAERANEIPQVSHRSMDSSASSGNYLSLRPPMEEPTTATQQERGLKLIKSGGDDRPPVERHAEPPARTTEVSRPVEHAPRAAAVSRATEGSRPLERSPRPTELTARQAELSARPAELFAQSSESGAAPTTALPFVKPTIANKPAIKNAPPVSTPEKAPYVVSRPTRETSDKMPPLAPVRVAMNKPVPKAAIAREPIPEPKEEPGKVSNFFSKFKQKAKNFLSPESENSQNEELKETAQKKDAPNIDGVSEKKTEQPESQPAIANQPTPPEPTKTDTESQSPPVEVKQPPIVSLTQNSSKGYTIKIVSADKSDLNFTSFRLHNPERFVIDLQDQRGLQTATVPQPENNEYLKAIRVGAPDPTKSTGRLVLDLSADNVSVIPGDASSVNEVSFVIGEALDPVAGLTPPPGSVLVLDAGHGGTDAGAQRGFVKEKDLTLAIAQKTRAKLVESGVKVIMTRSDDTFIPLPDRVSITNTTKPDLFLSVHINALESTKDIYGIETYYQTDMSKALAQNIHEALVTELKAPDRAIRKAKFYVVNRAEVPAVLAEVGFISNKAERDKLVSEDYQEKIAGALAKGAILYLKQHSAVAGKVSRASDSTSENALGEKEIGSTIPRAKSLVHKGLGIKSN